MTVMLAMSIFWTLYGIAGLLGFQIIPERHRGKSRTRDYIRACGIGWLLIGVPWMILYFVSTRCNMSRPETILFMVATAVPSFIFGIVTELKYSSASDEDDQEEHDSNSGSGKDE